MLQLALAALLAGSLIAGGTGGDDKDKKAKAQAQQPIECILVTDRISEDDPINDTYALGRTERIPLKLWIGYARATEVAQEAHATGRSVYELVLEKGLLSREKLDEILKPEALTKPGYLPEGK